MKYFIWILLMEDFSFQLKLKNFPAKTPAVQFCSADQLSSELLFFVCMGCNWEISLLWRLFFFWDAFPVPTSR